MNKSIRKAFTRFLRAGAGFTLIEVMLAVTVLSLGLVMTVRSYTNSLYAIKTSEDFLISGLLLEEKIWQKQEEQLRLGVIAPEAEQADFAAPMDKFSYKLSFEEDQELPSLQKAVFEVVWKTRAREHANSCVTYLRSERQ